VPIVRNGSNPAAKGPAANFTGNVRIETPFAAVAPGRVAGAIVTFEPGARSAWHTHPLGQVLIVTSGLGWTQQEDGQVEVMRPGDIVQCPPNVRHWHGGTPTTSCTHVAIAESLDGKSVEWLEHVTDQQYHAGENSAERSGGANVQPDSHNI
jgi:quercetin dioxygenase-like cupin family protein